MKYTRDLGAGYVSASRQGCKCILVGMLSEGAKRFAVLQIGGGQRAVEIERSDLRSFSRFKTRVAKRYGYDVVASCTEEMTPLLERLAWRQLVRGALLRGRLAA